MASYPTVGHGLADTTRTHALAARVLPASMRSKMRRTSEGREIRLAIAQAGSGRKGEEPKAANQFYAGDRRWSAELRAHQKARAAGGGAILDLFDRALFGRIQHGGEQPVEMLAHRQARRG